MKNSAPGESKCSKQILQLLDEKNWETLCNHLNKTITNKDFTGNLSNALVKLFFKKGKTDQTALTSFRPIVLEETLIKLIGQAWLGTIHQWLTESEVVSNNHWAFLPGKAAWMPSD